MSVVLQQLVNGVSLGGIYTLVALGLSLIFGILDIINFAHGEFYMVGAYLFFLSSVVLGMSPWVALLLALVGGALIGILSERLVFRPIRGTAHTNSIVVSMGLALVLANSFMAAFTPTPRRAPPLMGETAVNVLGTQLSGQRLFVLAVSVLLIVLVTLYVERTWTGLALRATAQDQVASRLMGVSIDRVGSTTFALGAALAAVAGALVSPLFVVEPHMGGMAGLKAFAVVILGGVGSIPGAIVAGMLLGVAETLTAGFISSAFKDLVAFVAMIGVLLVKPSGIWGRVLH